MEKKSANRGLVFLLIFLVAIGIFLLYTKLTFTGFATNIPGGSVSSYDLSAGAFNGTKIDNSTTPYAVVLSDLNNLTSGTYTSPFLSVPSGIEVVWSNFAPNFNLPQNSTIAYSARACADTNCSGNFNSITPGSINLVGKYLQYEIFMQGIVTTNYNNVTNTTSNSLSSPKFYGADINYSISIPLTVIIDSPQNITYSNESVLIKISTINASSVWFTSDGGSNEIYTSELNRVFSQGGHVIIAWANDTSGHIISQTKSFAVLFPVIELYCGDGICSPSRGEVSENCPQDCGASNTTSESGLPLTGEVPACTPDWQCAEWTACVSGTQTRQCSDVNGCGLVTGMPDATQSCTAVNNTTTTTITPPAKKGFFSVVGNVISVPFSNAPRAILSILVILIVIAFFVSKFYFKKDLLTLVKRTLNIRKKTFSIN